MSSTWKAVERRICQRLGGQRSGNRGARSSDCVHTPWAVEIKWTARINPAVNGRWIQQARDQGAYEKKPWLLVVCQKATKRPIVTMDFTVLLGLLDENRALITENERLSRILVPRGAAGGVEGACAKTGAQVAEDTEDGQDGAGGWTDSRSARSLDGMSEVETPQPPPSPGPPPVPSAPEPDDPTEPDEPDE